MKKSVLIVRTNRISQLKSLRYLQNFLKIYLKKLNKKKNHRAQDKVNHGHFAEQLDSNGAIEQGVNVEG